MAVLNGDVNVRIAISGQGDGAKKVADAEKAVESLKREVGAAGAAGSKMTQALGGVRESIKPLDGVRGLFENLRSNLFAFPAAIGAAVGGFASLISSITEAGSATERLREMAQDYASNMTAVEQRIRTIREFLGSAGGGLKFFGADVGDEASKLTDQLLTLQQRQRELTDEAQALRDALGDNVFELTSAEHYQTQILRIGNEIRDVERQSAELRERSVEAMEKIAGISRRILLQGLGGLKAGGSRGAAIDLDQFGGPTIIGPSGRGGGGRSTRRERTAADIIAELARGADENARAFTSGLQRDEERELLKRLAGYDQPAANDNTPQGKAGKDAEKHLAGIAHGIRDVTAALSEALPGMGEWSVALSQIAEIWGKWGGAAGDTKDAVVGSLGAIAKAGAQQIKDERVRAGVLSIIELGLGFANLANPAIAAGHFTASAVLGSVALFGGGSARGSGSGGSRGAGGAAPIRVGGGEMLGQRAVSVVINGNYYGGRSEQEAGADFSRLTRRTQGTGFERGRDAA